MHFLILGLSRPASMGSGAEHWQSPKVLFALRERLRILKALVESRLVQSLQNKDVPILAILAVS